MELAHLAARSTTPPHQMAATPVVMQNASAAVIAERKYARHVYRDSHQESALR